MEYVTVEHTHVVVVALAGGREYDCPEGKGGIDGPTADKSPGLTAKLKQLTT